MAVTASDIARAAGVGKTTVLRALWDRDDINPETKARIKKIAHEMKYRPNYIARSLVSGQSALIGLMVTPSIFAGSFKILDAFKSALQDAGYTLVLETSNDSAGEKKALDKLMLNRVAGVIAVPSSNPADSEIYSELVESGIKLVIVDRYVEGVRAPQIVGDDYRSSRLAADHLISLGHKNIVYLGIPQTSYAGRERARGFIDAMHAAGLKTSPSYIIDTQFGDEYGAKAMAGVLRRSPMPTAVIARHDVVAAGAMRAIYDAGLTVPQDISIVGNGDMWCSDVLRVPLTTVQHPLERMAGIALEKLLDLLKGIPVEPEKTVLDVNLVVRSSTAPPRTRLE